MSQTGDDREGLSPPPPNILDLFDEDDDESDDVYQPAAEESGMSELASTTEDEDGEEGAFADAHERLGGIEIVFEGEDDEDEEGDDTERENDESETSPAPGQGGRITIQDLNQILGSQGTLRRLLMQRYRLLQPGGRRVIIDNVDDDDDDDDDDDNYGVFRRRSSRRPKHTGDPFPKIPSDAGRALMDSGNYGQRDDFTSTRRRRGTTFSERLMWRRLGLDPRPHTRKAKPPACPRSRPLQHISRQDNPLRLESIQWPVL